MTASGWVPGLSDTRRSDWVWAEVDRDDSPSGESTSGDRPSGESPSGESPSGDRPSGERPSGESPSGDRPSGGRPSGESPSGDRPSGESPSGESPSGATPASFRRIAASGSLVFASAALSAASRAGISPNRVSTRSTGSGAPAPPLTVTVSRWPGAIAILYQ